ncbi:PA14 domain-containing protein [Motilimonas pumila]|uniref:PA14 domain-containing protein n=1 Tax=Motilimonas pumila TaxID=2303987 RepID=A0A418YBU0_9GAMM|nr:PA14 domain-containing protein [Motilimonas pumila]RJG41909.1 hypothetical protein D1Z90_15565 [Motilimonas pumila]
MRYYPLLMALVATLAVAVISQFILYNFPNSADEYAYVFQAKNLAQGLVYSPIHPPNAQGEWLQHYFYFVHIGETDGKYYGRFPFGYSLLLIPSVWIESLSQINTYWLVNSLFAGFTVVLIFQFARRFFDLNTAIVACVMAVLCPWFLLTSGSYFSHTTNAFFVGLFLYLFCLSLEQKQQKLKQQYLLVAGCCFGFAVVIRFLDPLPYLLVILALYRFWHSPCQRAWLKDIAWFALGGSIWAVLLFSYNYLLTGDALQTAYEYYNPQDQGTRFIFMVPTESGAVFDWSRIYDVGWLKRTLPNTLLLLDWHIWVGCLCLLPLAWYRHQSQPNNRLLLLALLASPVLVITIYMLYGGPPANQYGPRYFFSFFVPITLLAAACLTQAVRQRWLVQVIVLLLAVVSVQQLYRHSAHFEDKVFERTNLYRTIEAANIDNAVVVLKTGSGSMHQVDLPRNQLDFSDSVLITQHHDNMGPLIRAYPERQFFFYHYRGAGQLGQLTPLLTDPDGSYQVQYGAIDKTKVLLNSQGLIGQYYQGRDFDKLAFQRLDQSFDFNWKHGAPGSLSKDNFSIRWQGLFHAPSNGSYTFYTSNDDGVKLAINQQVLIENWYGHGTLDSQKAINLAAGQHQIAIEYFDAKYDAHLQVWVQGPNQAKQLLTGQHLTAITP